MTWQIEKDIVERLRAFKRSPLKQEAFRVWVGENRSRLAQQCAPGLVLKLGSPDIQRIMSSIAALVAVCPKCEKIGEQRIFASRTEQLSYSGRVDAALSGGVFVRIKRPQWLHLDDTQLGADAYFECTSCGGLWMLVEPERQDNGMWQRVA